MAIDGFFGLNTALIVPFLSRASSGMDPWAPFGPNRLQTEQPVRTAFSAFRTVTNINLNGVIGVE